MTMFDASTPDDIVHESDLMECRWCGKQITRDRHAWVDNTGFYNCGRYRPHWPAHHHTPPRHGRTTMTDVADYGCCALDPDHDGACEWVCGDCDGTGRCVACDTPGVCICDDVVRCEWCDGSHACPAGCLEGRTTEEWP